MKKVLTLFVIVLALVLSAGTVQADGQKTCPDGNGWTKIDSGDLSSYPVSDAVEYCFKGGSSKTQGCTPYLVYGDDISVIPDGDHVCGLSHWSYRLKKEETPPPTPTPTPTETPPEETPTPTPPKRKTPTPTPELPDTGVAYIEGSSLPVVSDLIIPSIGVHTGIVSAPQMTQYVWNINGIGMSPAILQNTKVIVGHVALVGGRQGVFYNLKNVTFGDTLQYAGNTYVVVSSRAIPANYYQILDSNQLVLMTCADWNGAGYSSRYVVIADVVP